MCKALDKAENPILVSDDFLAFFSRKSHQQNVLKQPLTLKDIQVDRIHLLGALNLPLGLFSFSEFVSERGSKNHHLGIRIEACIISGLCSRAAEAEQWLCRFWNVDGRHYLSTLISVYGRSPEGSKFSRR